MLKGLYLVGKVVAEEVLNPYTSARNGKTYNNKNVSFDVGGMQNVIVKIPVEVDLKILEKDKDGNIFVPVQASSWVYDSNKNSRPNPVALSFR